MDVIGDKGDLFVQVRNDHSVAGEKGAAEPARFLRDAEDERKKKHAEESAGASADSGGPPSTTAGGECSSEGGVSRSVCDEGNGEHDSALDDEELDTEEWRAKLHHFLADAQHEYQNGNYRVRAGSMSHGGRGSESSAAGMVHVEWSGVEVELIQR